MVSRRLRLFVLALSLADAAVAVGQTARHVLPNGLTVLYRQERSLPLVALNLYVRAGAATEGRHGGAGLSHLLEHTLFNGTRKSRSGDFSRRIRAWGGEVDAHTYYDRTVLCVTLPRGRLDGALEALADMACNAAFPVKAFVREREVIRREIAQDEDTPLGALENLLHATVFRTHPYRHSVLGGRPAFDRLDRDDVLAYYRSRFCPDNAVLTLAGDFDLGKARRLVRRRFGPWAGKAAALKEPATEPTQRGPRRVVRSFPVKNGWGAIAWRCPSVGHADSVVMELVASLLVGCKTSPAYQRIKLRDGLVHQLGGQHWAARHHGLFTLRFTFAFERLDRFLAALEREIASLREHGPGAAALGAAKARVEAEALRARETVDGLADLVGLGELQRGDPDWHERYGERVKRVTARAIRDAVRRYLCPTGRTLVVLAPEDRPALLPVKALTPLPRPSMLSVKERRRGPWSGGGKASPERLQRFVLPGGMRLVVMERPRLPLVSLVLHFQAGQRYETGWPPGISRFLASMLMRGTKRLPGGKAMQIVESRGGRMRSAHDPESIGVRMDLHAADWDLGLALMADLSANCACTPDGVARARRYLLGRIALEADDGEASCELAFRRVRYPGHPWGRSDYGTAAALRTIGSARLRAYHRAHCSSGRAVLVVVGDVKAETIRRRVGRRFRSLSSRASALTPPPAPVPPKGVRVMTEMPRRTQSVVTLAYPACVAGNVDRYALDVLNGILSGLGNRLTVNLREKKGLAYDIGSYLETAGDRRSQVLYAVTAPERVDELARAMAAEVGRLRKALVQPGEVERAKSAIVGELAIALQSNAALAASIAENEILGLGYRFDSEYAGKIDRVDGWQVRQVARRYLRTERAFLVVAGPTAR